MSVRSLLIRWWAWLHRNQPYCVPKDRDAHRTYLHRYGQQYQVFRETLPRIVERRIHGGQRALIIGVVGSSTGEEVASLLAAVILAFADHPEWGAPKTWQIEIRGLELDVALHRASELRLNGLHPLVVHQRLRANSIGYRDAVVQTMEALNRNPRWSKRAMRCWVADAYAEGGLRQLAGSDVLFFNSVFLSKDRTAAGRQLAQDHAQAFIFTTAMPGEIPAIGTSGSHKFDVHLTASRRLAFTVATPIGLADARAPLIAIHEAEYLEEPDFFVPLEPE